MNTAEELKAVQRALESERDPSGIKRLLTRKQELIAQKRPEVSVRTNAPNFGLTGCPFCGGKSCFAVHPVKRIYHCFDCGEGGFLPEDWRKS